MKKLAIPMLSLLSVLFSMHLSAADQPQPKTTDNQEEEMQEDDTEDDDDNK